MPERAGGSHFTVGRHLSLMGARRGRQTGGIPVVIHDGFRSISVLVPTRNEAGNVGPLVKRITASASAIVSEIIFIDDSDDHTPDVVRRVASESDVPVRLIHRDPSQRTGGLGSAVIEGINAADSDWVLVMDGDLQHPPEIIPDIVAAAQGGHRAVVASRLLNEDAAANTGPFRTAVTNMATSTTRAMFPRQLANITDPLTGFFLVDRRALPADLKPDGFKILLEILIRSRDLNPTEVGFDFGDRVSGRSKASVDEGVRFGKLLLRLRLSRPAKAAGKPQRRQRSHRYSIHGVITIASDARLPELEWFRTQAPLNDPDIEVNIGKPKNGATTGMEFKEAFGWAGFAARVEHGDNVQITASRAVGRSPHVLYTNLVEPVLRWEFVSRGYALVHSACVVKDGSAYLVTARTDTGKTTTALKLLEDGDLEFLSDDLSLVTPEGTLLTYPKPMTMSYHTVQAVNPEALQGREKLTLQPQSRLHSRSGRRVGLGLAKTSFPAASANAAVQFLVPPPKYPVTKILPGTKIATSGIPVHLFIIARGPESKRRLGWEEAAEMLLANCEDAYGFPPYESIESYMLGRSEEDLRAREREVILRAVASFPATLFQSTTYGWADAIRAEIDADRAAVVPFGDAGPGKDHETVIVDFTEREEGDAAASTIGDEASEAAG